MNSFYLFKSGTLKRQDYSLIFQTEDESILIPIQQVETIFCFGEVNLNKRILELLAKHGVSLHFFNYYGQLCGSYHPMQRKAGKILIEQVNAYQNSSERLKIGKSIQEAAFRNMLALLKYYGRSITEFSELISNIEANYPELKAANTIDEMMLIEARTKKIYYSGFDCILRPTSFRFDQRMAYHPKNEVNSLMTFGYHLLYSTVLSLIDQSRISSEIAFIHSDLKAGSVLQFDLADIYKPILIDRLVFRLIRKGEIKKEYFNVNDEIIFLNETGRRIFVEEYNKELNKTILINGRHMSYRSIIKKDINHLANYIIKKEKTLSFTKFKW